MMKYSITIFLLFQFQLTFGQVDTITVNGIRRLVGDIEMTEYCRFKHKKNKFYYEEIGESYHYFALANGWFKLNKNCSNEAYLSNMIEGEFYLDSTSVYLRYKKGKLYSGRIKETNGDYVLIGHCKKGKLFGIVTIKKNNKVIWSGELFKN